MKASIKRINLPDAPEPTRAKFKKPVINYNPKYLKCVQIPSVYDPKPVPALRSEVKQHKQYDPTAHLYGRKDWTDERKERLIQMYNAGMTFDEIGVELQCSSKMACVMANRLRKEGRIEESRFSTEWSEEQIQTLIDMYNDGKPYRMIATATGKGLSTVSRKVLKLKDKGVLHARNCRKRRVSTDRSNRRDM